MILFYERFMKYIKTWKIYFNEMRPLLIVALLAICYYYRFIASLLSPGVYIWQPRVWSWHLHI